MVMPKFVSQALDGAPITVYGTGQQSRCFCDVREAVEAILRLVSTTRAVGQVVNIGSDQEISMEGLARLVKERTGSSSPITYIPYDEAYEPGFEDMHRRGSGRGKTQESSSFPPPGQPPRSRGRVRSGHSEEERIASPARRSCPRGDPAHR